MIEQETQPEAIPGPRNAPEGLPVPPTTSVPRAVWQVRVRTKLDDLYQQLAALATRDLEQAAALRAQLSGVEAVLGRSGVIEWLRGGKLEYAWQTIHWVERAMVGLRSADELTGLLPAYRSAAAQVLPADDKVLTDLDTVTGGVSADLLRARVQALLLRCHAVSDEFHESARRLRNRMLGLSVFALVAEVLMVLVQWRSHDVRLLEAPTDAGGVPAWRLLFFVLIAGALGGGPQRAALDDHLTVRRAALQAAVPAGAAEARHRSAGRGGRHHAGRRRPGGDQREQHGRAAGPGDRVRRRAAGGHRVRRPAGRRTARPGGQELMPRGARPAWVA
ncbi:hypothetical protein ACFWRG_27330 [Micromonospora tulbaghiae]|uniref:hypothetical protein n=1 Tax=Micromonospora tulbaghiae TaxID=479978 RepID=UPI003665D3ED